jgi:hypothetical protein
MLQFYPFAYGDECAWLPDDIESVHSVSANEPLELCDHGGGGPVEYSTSPFWLQNTSGR